MKKYQVIIPKKIKRLFEIIVETSTEKKTFPIEPETRNFQFDLSNEFEYIYARKIHTNPIFNVYFVHEEKIVQLVPQEI